MELFRYHKDVFMPRVDLKEFWEGIKMVWVTHHFLMRFNERRLKNKGFFIPTKEQLKKGELFELYLNSSNHIEKICLRLQGKKSDYCFVVGNNGGIITAWATGKYNKYERINKTIYCKEVIHV